MTDNGTPIIKVALLCDDVRREISGKEIFNRVYGDAVNVLSFPFLLRIMVYLKVMYVKSDLDYNVEFRVVNESGNQLVPVVRTNFSSMDPTKSTTIVLGPMPLQIQSPGLISFQWRRTEAAEWITIITLRTSQAPPGAVPPGAKGVILKRMTNA